MWKCDSSILCELFSFDKIMQRSVGKSTRWRAACSAERTQVFLSYWLNSSDFWMDEMQWEKIPRACLPWTLIRHIGTFCRWGLIIEWYLTDSVLFLSFLSMNTLDLLSGLNSSCWCPYLVCAWVIFCFWKFWSFDVLCGHK